MSENPLDGAAAMSEEDVSPDRHQRLQEKLDLNRIRTFTKTGLRTEALNLPSSQLEARDLRDSLHNPRHHGADIVS